MIVSIFFNKEEAIYIEIKQKKIVIERKRNRFNDMWKILVPIQII